MFNVHMYLVLRDRLSLEVTLVECLLVVLVDFKDSEGEIHVAIGIMSIKTNSALKDELKHMK